MDEKKNIFDIISQIFATFGLIVLIFVLFSVFIGKEASEVSALFELGSAGLSCKVLAEVLILSVLITLFENLFLTDRIIKEMALPLRYVLFFLAVMIVIVAYVVCFGWFPITYAPAWAGFIISFVICTAGSVLITNAATKAENRKMEDALERYKKSK